ncbi:MAG: cobyric acid synthase [Oscillospiraceae bacterium]|jgi:adenosylcobyric acid synthase|nr:cobyric acid synthase [Oscillospiraceae bacterium]
MAKAIMVQGTMSNAGKSILTAGLCRVFKQDGYKAAPFKAQNMALNSFITRDGLEMGRAQVVQAEAAGIEPDVRMNPILLKPVSNVGSQVIVNGEVFGNVGAVKYYDMKQQLIPSVKKAFDSLAEDYDIIVIEGAGSPVEVNLPKDEFVNMGMAKLANAPVLLVGDIDRGGVFAQLYGTVSLLTEDERKYLKAVIINKFRGDAEILRPGLKMMEDLCGVPVAGVVPFLDADIDDEDSLSERLTRVKPDAVIDVAVIRLPHISNFTDFAALEAADGVGVRYVRQPSDLGNPDMVIIPGTKSTIADLRLIRQSGLEGAIKRLAENGTVIVGICGGYQMLGEVIVDSEGAEGGGEIGGMGLLPVETEFAAEKHRTRVTAKTLTLGGALAPLSGASLDGYEIHMGATKLNDGASPLALLENGQYDGCFSGNIYGTYLHGFFDSAECRSALVNALCKVKGVTLETSAFDLKEYKDRQYDLLAKGIRENLDMELIYKILNSGV